MPLSRVVIVLASATLCGCLGDAVTGGGSGDVDASTLPDAGPSVPSTPGGPGPNARIVFETTVQGILLGDCGSCHANTSNTLAPHFLVANPDLLTTVTTW